MSVESEIRWFAGCIGMAGETNAVKLGRALDAYGRDRFIDRPVKGEPDPETAWQVYVRLFDREAKRVA